MFSVATEDKSSVATENMSSVATEKMSSVATEDISPAVAETKPSVTIREYRSLVITSKDQ